MNNIQQKMNQTGMKDKRKPGQSQLDYLWTTYGIYSISGILEKDVDEYIPTQSLLIQLLKDLGDRSVGGISIKDENLIVYSTTGSEIDRIDISELSANSVSISDFGSKLVSSVDISMGCPYDLYEPVYYIALSNGKQFWAKQNTLKAIDSSTIHTEIKNNEIISTLKLDTNQGNIILTDKNGLKAELPIEGLDSLVSLHFLTQEEYDNLPDIIEGAIYLIKDKSYFYFNNTRVGNLDLFEIVDILPTIGNANKIYLVQNEAGYSAYIYVNGLMVSIGNVGQDTELRKQVDILSNNVDTIKNNLNWIEY